MTRFQPFFIIGAPASGTALVQTALNRYSQIEVIPPTNFFSLLRLSERRQHDHWRRIEQRLQIRVDPPARRLRAGAEARQQFERIATDYLVRLDRSGITHVGEMSPGLQCQIPLILRTFPEAKLVLIYRDGREVALSLTRLPGKRGRLFGHFLTWLRYYRIQRRLVRQQPQRVFCMRYEDLVINPDDEIRLASRFLGIGGEPENPEENDQPGGRSEDKAPGDPGLRLTSDLAACGQTSLPRQELASLERWGGWALRELHYECSGEMRRLLPPWLTPTECCRFTYEWALHRLHGLWTNGPDPAL